MNNKPNEQLDDLLARATEALRDGQPSDAPPPELVASTIERMRLLDSQPTTITLEPDIVRLAKRRQLMFRIARYSSAVAALIAVSVFGWLLFMNQGNHAFAGMLENVKKAESVTLTNKQTIGVGRTMEMKMYFEGKKMRLEFPGITAYVTDFESMTGYELHIPKKVARSVPVDRGGAAELPNPVEQLRKVKPDDAMLIGEEQIDGRKVQVYQVDKVDFLDAKGQGQMKIWVDPETDLPVKLLVDNPNVERSKRTTLTFTDIVWNQDLDDSLFQVPADFTVTEGQGQTK
jgi:outer membrane lipoprotein-sorting protein